MKSLIIFVCLIFFIITDNSAQDLEAVKNSNLPYQFWVHYPEGYKDNPKKKYPLLMYLHGRSIQGNNLEMVKKYGVIYETLRGLKIDFIVIAPQCQNGWDNTKLLKILDYAENTYRVDKNRVYLTGMSMGGYGAWYFAGAHPDRFAAVAPVCGGGKLSDAQNLKKLPHWVHHGVLDKPVPIAESEKMVKAIRAAGNKNVEFSVYKNWGHSELVAVFADKNLYKWFLKHTINGKFDEEHFVENIKATQNDKKNEVAKKELNTLPTQNTSQRRELKPVISTSTHKKNNVDNSNSQSKEKDKYIKFEEPDGSEKKSETKTKGGSQRPTLVQRKPENKSPKMKEKLENTMDKIKDWDGWNRFR